MSGFMRYVGPDDLRPGNFFPPAGLPWPGPVLAGWGWGVTLTALLSHSGAGQVEGGGGGLSGTPLAPSQRGWQHGGCEVSAGVDMGELSSSTSLGHRDGCGTKVPSTQKAHRSGVPRLPDFLEGWAAISCSKGEEVRSEVTRAGTSGPLGTTLAALLYAGAPGQACAQRRAPCGPGVGLGQQRIPPVRWGLQGLQLNKTQVFSKNNTIFIGEFELWGALIIRTLRWTQSCGCLQDNAAHR